MCVCVCVCACVRIVEFIVFMRLYSVCNVRLFSEIEVINSDNIER